MESAQQKTPDFGLGTIDDVSHDTWAYVRRDHMVLFTAVTAVSVVASLIFLYLFFITATHASNDSGSNSIYFVVTPLVVPFLLYAYYRQRVQHLFIQQIATSIGFSYSASAPWNSTSGTFFSIGHSQSLSDVLSGTYKGQPVRIFSYQYTVGYGKNSHTYSYTVFELDYGAPLPHVIMNVPELLAPSDVERVQLEGGFDEHFKLYVSKGQQMEIREIFQPDVMQDLVSSFASFTMEISGSKIYLMRAIVLSKRQVFLDFVSLIDHLFDKIIPELHAIAAPHTAATSSVPSSPSEAGKNPQLSTPSPSAQV